MTKPHDLTEEQIFDLILEKIGVNSTSELETWIKASYLTGEQMEDFFSKILEQVVAEFI